MKRFTPFFLKLKQMPQLRYGNPKVSVGDYYKIIDIEGSNVWFIDDDGNRSTCGSCRFDIGSGDILHCYEKDAIYLLPDVPKEKYYR